uniref:Transposon protein, putative, CACTA, En/Spm sub-class n=1 Tax=Oryza sativa subsp. japonica TaxID=39947 RepID=Q2QPA1_ORYSJ|nr:transposon protein, putative, CACTA, En/Spm sub-class [Oryza sativa Japonica Group]
MAQNVPSKGVKMPMDSADWNDYNTRVVCEIFVEQVAAGNRPNTHLSNPGYNEVIEKFAVRTGLRYTRLQIKNKWDKHRVEYNCWKKLTSQTGLGWDNTKETVTATVEHWKQLKGDIPGCTKFMKAGLQNEELLQKMFEDIRNTGADHWSLGQSTIPTPTNEAIHIADDNEIDEETEDDEPSAKRKRGGGSKVDKSKKSKSGSQKMVEEMSKSNELSAQTLSSIQSFTKTREDPPGCSIKDVMALVEECCAVEGTNEHFIATEIFIKKDQREMFVNSLCTPAGCFAWLKKKYEVKYGN